MKRVWLFIDGLFLAYTTVHFMYSSRWYIVGVIIWGVNLVNDLRDSLTRRPGKDVDNLFSGR